MAGGKLVSALSLGGLSYCNTRPSYSTGDSPRLKAGEMGSNKDDTGSVSEKTLPRPIESHYPLWLPEETYESVEERVGIQDEEDQSLSHNSSLLYPEPSKTIVSFALDDPDNPFQWSSAYKAFVVFVGIVTVINSTLGSSIPSGDSPELSTHFNVTNSEQLVLPNSIFLVGYVLGPVVFGPLSEQYGRQVVMIASFAGYTLFTMATCLAPNFAAFVVFRLFCGIFASSPISVTGGIYADLYENPISRGRAMAIFMAATTWGPQCGPIVSGYLGRYGWRWPFWFGLIFAGVSWIPLVFLPETYGPELLRRRAKNIRKETGGTSVFAPIELESTNLREILVKVATRPFRMFFTEAIVLFSSLFLCMIYAVFYMFFQVFPVIYPPIYGFSLGEEGLAFIPIGLGSILACFIYLWWDIYLEKAKAREAAWSRTEEYRRLPLACIGGPFFVIGMFWIGWTARADIPWIVPMLGGIPLGIGFLLLFMAFINYVVDAYEIFAASAVAATSCSRSVFGACLPFAGLPMFDALGVAWACSLLGFLTLGMCTIPFVFIRFGDKIRANSKFCKELKEQKRQKAQNDEERRKREEYWVARRARDSLVEEDRRGKTGKEEV